MGLGSRWRENPAQWRVDMGALRVQSPGLGALQCGAVPARGVRKSTNGRESTTRRRKRRKQEQRKESNSLSLRNAVRTHLSRCVCVRLCVIVYVFVTFYAFISLSLSPSLPLSHVEQLRASPASLKTSDFPPELANAHDAPRRPRASFNTHIRPHRSGARAGAGAGAAAAVPRRQSTAADAPAAPPTVAAAPVLPLQFKMPISVATTPPAAAATAATAAATPNAVSKSGPAVLVSHDSVNRLPPATRRMLEPALAQLPAQFCLCRLRNLMPAAVSIPVPHDGTVFVGRADVSLPSAPANKYNFAVEDVGKRVYPCISRRHARFDASGTASQPQVQTVLFVLWPCKGFVG